MHTLPIVVLAAATAAAQAPPAIQTTGVPDAYRVSAARGDVDGDGLADLVIGRNGPFSLRTGLAPASAASFGDEHALGIAVGPSCENPGQPVLADLDGDGDLDLLSVDTPLGARGHVVWFANDGKGRFAAAAPLRTADGAAFACDGQTSAVAAGDWNGDGRCDLVLATPPRVALHLGSDRGFTAVGRDLAAATQGAVALADWNRDGALDLLVVDGDRLVVRLRNGEGLGAPLPLAQLEGDPGQARVSVADWNGDGRADAWLDESLARPVAAAARTDDDEGRLAIARQILALIDAERAAIDRSKPPSDDAAAMARREARRAELARWAEGPNAVVAESAPRSSTTYDTRERLVVGR